MRAALIDKPLSIIFTEVPEPKILHPAEVKIHIKVTGIYSGSLVKTDFLGNIMNEHNNLIPANINHAV